MFQALTSKFQSVFRSLTGRAVLSESNIREAMQDVRTALLEADVNYDVVERFIADCQQECLGEKVLKNVQPGQQAVHVVYEKLTALLGEQDAPLQLDADPAIIMLCGLHGSGKTTTSAKLAKYLKDKHHKKVLLVGCDLARPAAMDQLSYLAGELGIRVYVDRTTSDVTKVASDAVAKAREEGLDAVILDTAGRLQIDEELVQELIRVKRAVQPHEILLVGDAALGQQAVSVAEHFHKALEITGIILTKLDGDARGGAALSMHQVTGRPVKFLCVGEKPNDLEMFHPDRMASRILGMGDVISLFESAAEEIQEEEARQMEERLRKNNFGFDDFLTQMHHLKRMGGLLKMLRFLPGFNNLPDNVLKMGEAEMKKTERMIQSMTPAERRNPQMINQSRRMRIAKGSHTTAQDVSALMKNFQMMRDMIARMNKNGGLGAMMGGMGGMGDSSETGGDLLGNMGNMLGGGMGGMYQPPRMGGAASGHSAKEQQKRLEKKKQAKAARKKNRH